MRSFAAAIVWATLTPLALAQTGPLVQRELAGRDSRFIEIPTGTADAGFRAILPGRHIAFDRNGVDIQVRAPEPNAVRQKSLGIGSAARLRYSFDGGAPSAPQGKDPSPTTYHWLVGAPSQWRTNLKSYGALSYRNVWPGIDAFFIGESRGFKYQFELAAGADPAQVWMRVEGADDVQLTASGALEWRMGTERMVDDAPVAFQTRGGIQTAIATRYRVEHLGANTWRIGFSVAPWDRNLPLVIDPAWVGYSGLVGGNAQDQVYSVARDADENTYACGVTRSPNLVLSSAYRGDDDAFLVRFNAAGVAQSVTYIGGEADDSCRGLVVQPSGLIYLAGGTESTQFPAVGTADPLLRREKNGGRDAFVLRLKNQGSQIDYSGFIGGAEDDQANSLAVDGLGRAYVTGFSSCTGGGNCSFPTVVGPNLTRAASADASRPSMDGFIARVKADGSSLDYAGFIGGDGYFDVGHAIAVDASGSAYVAGATDSVTGLPAAPGFRSIPSGDASDGFVARISASGAAVDRFTLLTGTLSGNQSGADRALAIALDTDGTVIVAGETDSSDFPLNSTGSRDGGPGLQASPQGGMDGFWLRMSSDLGQVLTATYLGGSGYDSAEAVAIDGAAWYIAGNTNPGIGFPTKTQSGVATTRAGAQDGFITKIDASTPSTWAYAGFLGTSANEAFFGMTSSVVEGKTILSLGGATTTQDSSGLINPVTAALTGDNATSNGLVLRIDPFGPPSELTVETGSPQSTPIATAFAAPLSVRVQDGDNQPLSKVVVTFTAPAATGASTNFATTTTATTDSNGIASLLASANGFAGTYTVTAQAGAASVSFSLTNAKGAQSTLAVTATATTLPFGSSTPLSITGGSGMGLVSYAVTAGSANCAVAGNVLSATAVGSCTVTTTKAADANYEAATATVDVNIVKASQPALIASATPTSLQFLATATLATSGGAGSGPVNFAVTAGGSACSVSGATLTAVGVGTCTVTATKGGDINYNDAIATVDVTVTKAAQTALTAQATPSSLPYGQTAQLSAQGGSGTGTVTYAVTAGAGQCSVVGSLLTANGTGSCTVTATKAGDANYNQAATTVTLTVTKAAQAPMELQAVPNVLAFGASATLSISGGSGTGVVSYTLSGGTGLCSLAGSTLTGQGAGTCTFSALKAGDANYDDATSSVTITVTKAAQGTLTAIATPAAIAKGDTSALGHSGGSGTGAVTFVVTDGGAYCAVTGSMLSGIAVGRCTVTATKEADGNYVATTATVAVDVGKAAQTIAFAALPDQFLGAPDATLGASSTSMLSVAFASQTPSVCSVTGTALRLLTTGLCTVRASQAGDASYAAAPVVDQSFAITLPAGSTPTITGSSGAGPLIAQLPPGSTWVFAPIGNGPQDSAGFIPLTGHPKSPASAPPASLNFPHGLFDFVAINGTPGTPFSITLTYPSLPALPPGQQYQYWKYGPTPSDPSLHWYLFAGAVIKGNTVTLTIVDGQIGDDDLVANSRIVDAGGLAVAAIAPGGTASIPTLSEWGLILLSLLMAMLGLSRMRRRQD